MAHFTELPQLLTSCRTSFIPADSSSVATFMISFSYSIVFNDKYNLNYAW